MIKAANCTCSSALGCILGTKEAEHDDLRMEKETERSRKESGQHKKAKEESKEGQRNPRIGGTQSGSEKGGRRGIVRNAVD